MKIIYLFPPYGKCLLMGELISSYEDSAEDRMFLQWLAKEKTRGIFNKHTVSPCCVCLSDLFDATSFPYI